MKPLARHMSSLAVLALLAQPASGLELTADRSGVSDLRFFAQNCLDALPDLEAAARAVRVRNQREQNGLTVVSGQLELFERNDQCICAASFFDWHTHLPRVVQNLHYVVKEEAGRAWQSATTDPTDIALDYDGVPAHVRIGYRPATTEGVLVVSVTVERPGVCPA